ncbi:peptidase M24 [Artomyces pyxidatus]|uniref:Peptidase M24 n=1 Tax=Artomyces pyxidatus TaxID=48021 RepID=A0ACB8T5A8_9AGAM|nr:peptidase M24 [Artomyces pyxidatus]
MLKQCLASAKAGRRVLPRPVALKYRRYATEASLNDIPKPSTFGQPTFQSHPHLVKPGEVTPGIPLHEYERRRAALMEGLPSGSLVVVVAGQVKYMSGGASYKFRQASDFWYLTGFQEPDSALVLEKNGSARGYRMLLYSTGKDPSKEKWDGAYTRFDDVVSLFGADEAHPIEDFPADLKTLVSSASHVYADVPRRERASRSSAKGLLRFLGGGRVQKGDPESPLDTVPAARQKPLAPLVGELRSVKSKWEQEVMRASADISGRAHAKTMRFAQPGLSEADLAAHFEYMCARGGSQWPAYVPVVASGENALIIHYTKNDHLLRDGELVLIDAGGEYNGYASDISRTFPVSGTFTPPQRELYAALLSAQKALVALCAADIGHSLDDLHRRSVELLRTELKQIGFELGLGALERVLYPHYLSHPVGIDLHEAGTFDRRAPLKEGMVITIEPGVYVPSDPAFPKHFHGLGIRIEDEVLVGKHDPVVLTVAAPKEIADIEGACQGALGFEPF